MPRGSLTADLSSSPFRRAPQLGRGPCISAPGTNKRTVPGLLSELKLAVPWGHIAVKVWGFQKNPPVLCLHGWQDNANSFDRLIPHLPKDFCYVAMDFGGHGLSTHYSPGLPYYHQNFVNEVRRVVRAFKWTRFSLMGHSFGGAVGGMFASMYPEMVDKLILLDTTPLVLDFNEVENIVTYKRKNIEQTLKVEDSQKPPSVFSPEEMLQGLLTKNKHLDEDCGELLLQRGTTKVADGLVLNRDRRLSWPQYSFDFMSKELSMQFLRSLQASVLMIKALQGYFDVRSENENDKKESFLLLVDMLRSTLRERFQFVEIPGNHYIHMNKPQIVADIVRSFLQGLPGTTPSRP